MNVMRLHKNPRWSKMGLKSQFIYRQNGLLKWDRSWLGPRWSDTWHNKEKHGFYFPFQFCNITLQHKKIHYYLICLKWKKREENFHLFFFGKSKKRYFEIYFSSSNAIYLHYILLNILHKFMGKIVNTPPGTNIQSKIKTKPTMFTFFSWIHCLIL